jgi:hypothetical protein
VTLRIVGQIQPQCPPAYNGAENCLLLYSLLLNFMHGFLLKDFVCIKLYVMKNREEAAGSWYSDSKKKRLGYSLYFIQ